jgi:cytochrome c peroxidase
VRVSNGPLTSAEIAGGRSPAQIAQGRALFIDQQCDSCHRGGLWSTSVKNFTSPPAGNEIDCEVNLAAAAPTGSFCLTAPLFGNPVAVQFLGRFLKNIGSFNLGVSGKGNPILSNVGAVEKAAPALVNGAAQPALDALGLDYNQDGRGLGFSVQSLLGGFNGPPYYHNGACETLACVISDVKHRTANGTLPDRLGALADQVLLLRYLEQIDAQSTPF